MKACGLLLFLVACAPSRASLFDPVRLGAVQRGGLEPRWGGGRSPVADRLLEAPLTPESAARVAVLRSPALQAEFEELAEAGAAVATARAAANPSLGAELRFPTSGDGPVELELSAMEDVTALLGAIPRAGVAGAELRAARSVTIARTIELAARARLRLFDAAEATARLALRKRVADAAGASAELARKLREAGNLTELALVREELFAEEALVALRGAEADAAAAREALGAVLGLGTEEKWQIADGILEGPAPAGEIGDLEHDAVVASLELEAARLRLEAAGGRVTVARADSFLPHLGLGVSATREHDGEWHAGPAIGLTLPIFDWGSGKRAAASAEVRRREQTYAALGLELRASARAARERLVATEEQVARIRDRLLPLRDRLLDESVRQYNAMSIGPFELLQARREQIAVEERYLDALRDAWAARTAVWELRAGVRPIESR